MIMILKIFSRQINGIGNEGDILFAISTSGNSKNIIEAAKHAKKKKLIVISITGSNKAKVHDYSSVCIKVPSRITAHIQELHIIVIHILCTLIECRILKK